MAHRARRQCVELAGGANIGSVDLNGVEFAGNADLSGVELASNPEIGSAQKAVPHEPYGAGQGGAGATM